MLSILGLWLSEGGSVNTYGLVLVGAGWCTDSANLPGCLLTDGELYAGLSSSSMFAFLKIVTMLLCDELLNQGD